MSIMPDRQHAVNNAGAGSGSESPARPARTEAGDAFSGVVVRLLRLAGALEDAGDALALPAGQTSARWRVLAAADDAPRSVADIARALGVARQSVQRVADTLEAAGAITYADNPRHRRARLVVLTDEGREALRRIEDVQRPWADALGARIGTRDLDRLATLLDRVSATLDAGGMAHDGVRDGGRSPGARRSAPPRARTG